MRRSKDMEKLRAGKSVLCTQVVSGDECLAGVAARIGADCLWICEEHATVTELQSLRCIRIAQAYDTDCMIRIRKSGYYSYFRPLEDRTA